MKKLAILVSIVFATVNAFAAVTTTSQIKLSSANQGDKVLRVVVADQFSDAYDNGYDAVVGAGQDGGLYIVMGGDKYVKFATNALAENLPLGFGSCDDLDYTLTFSNFSGASYVIYDKVADENITVNASTPAYNFTIAASEKNMAIEDRFVINYVAPAPAAPSLCFNYNVLEVNGHDGETLKIMQGDTEIVPEMTLGNTYSKDLSAYNGRLVVILNGQAYQIDANPATTPAN